MCYAAKFNGLKTSEHNCNVQLDQRCCGYDDSLAAQQYYAQVTSYGFVANERDMYEAMDTESYRYIVMLRESEGRYLSHWKHIRRSNGRYRESFASWWERQPDNWNLRKICGTACLTVPKYQITEDIFNYTIDRLHKFEDFLFVDRLFETFTKFANKVGWTNMTVPKESKLKIESRFDESVGQWDPMMSALDDALYEYADGLYHGVGRPVVATERMDAVENYFREGRDRNCNNICCAEKCSPY
jgi:hypothetical protein